MAAGATRNLFIQIGGGVSSDLTTQLKAGKSAMLELGDSADNVQATVRSAFEKLGGNVADQAKAMDQAYAKTFANIRATAQSALNAPSGTQGLVINLAAAKQEAAAAQESATYLRVLADAQAQLVESGQEATAGAKKLAVSLELQAIAAEKGALASTETVNGLQRLAAASGVAVNDLDEVAGAHSRMGASGLIAEHVVRSFADSVTAGQSPVRALALEIPRITEAMQFFANETGATEGALGKFASVMGGPVGLAITLGTSLLTPLVASLFENATAADAARKASEDYAKEQDGFADAIDKANGKLVERNRLLGTIALQEKGPEIKAQDDLAANFSSQAFAKARAGSVISRQVVAGIPTATVDDPRIVQAMASANGDVVKLRNNLDALAKSASGDDKARIRSLADEINHLAGQSVAASQKASELRGAASAVKTVLGGGSVLTTESVNRQIDESGANSPVEKARVQLRELRDQIAQVGAEPVSTRQQAELADLEKRAIAAAAAVKKLEDAQKEQRDGRQIGRQIDISQAEDIVRGIGGTVTSSYRSRAEQQNLYNRYLAGTGSLAAKPGTSLHETGQALDVAKTAGVSLASLKKAFEDAGVHLTEALDEGNHYHVGFGPKGPSADAIARRAQVAQTRAADQDGSFQSALRSALDGLAAAQGRQPQTPEQEYANTSQKLTDDFVQRDAELQAKVDAGKLTAAQALQIEAILYSTSQLDDESAKRKDLTSILDRQIKAEDASINAQVGLLQARLTATDGREGQRALAQQILDKRQQQERDDLDAKITNRVNDPQGADLAEIAKKTLPDQQAAERAALARQYASPGQKYLQGLNGTSISDSLEGAEVQGLGHLEDGLDGVLDGTKSIKAAFSDMSRSIIADLVKIGVQQAIIKPLANSLFGGSGGGGGLFGSIGKLLGLGGGGSSTSGGSASVDPDLFLAEGGHVSGPGTATSDSIPARLSAGEFVVNAKATRQNLAILHAINDNKIARFAEGGVVGSISSGSLSMPTLGTRDVQELSVSRQAPIVLQVQANDYFDAKVASISGGQVTTAAPHIAAGGADLARQNADRSQRRSLVR